MMHFKFNLGWNSSIEFRRRYLFTSLISLLLAALACGVVNPVHQFNNEIRLAVFKHEQERRSLAKDLVIHFQRDEPRTRFEGQNQNGGHTVWLYPAGAKEYFATRPQEMTYLYIQEITYNGDRSVATVNVYRGDGAGYQGWQLTIIRDATNGWLVTDEVAIE